MYHDYDMTKILEHLKSSQKKNLILDTDTYNEIDDQFAVAYAMLSEDIQLLALTAAPFFNSRSESPAHGMELSYQEMMKIRDFVDPDQKMNIPCYRGAKRYMPNIITPVVSEAAENIVRLVKEADDIVYVAAIGCYTNVASALLMDPSIMDKMVVIMMGSNAFELVDCNDFNLKQDRCSARVIFECGVPVIVLPAYGAAEKIITTNAEVCYYLQNQAGKLGNYLCDLLIREEGDPIKDGTGFRIVWDIAAIAVLRLGERVGNMQIVPARSITEDGMWRDLMSAGSSREMLYVKKFKRDRIFTDLFNVIRQSQLK